MGLDMYLYKTERISEFVASDYIELDNSRISDGEGGIFNEIMYWRSERETFEWFLHNVHNCINDMGLYEVNEHQLKELCNEYLYLFRSCADVDESLSYGEMANQIEDLIDSTDFDNEIVFFKSDF